MKNLVAILVLVLSVAQLWTKPVEAEPYQQFAARMVASGQFRSDIEKLVFQKLNAYRVSQGRAPLAFEPSLTFGARAHAQDMATHSFMGHRSSNGYDFPSRMSALIPNRGQLPDMGENAADTVMTGLSADAIAEKLTQMWIHSAGHRFNMVSRNFTKAAVGVAIVGNKAYGDQLFQGPPPANLLGLPIAGEQPVQQKTDGLY